MLQWMNIWPPKVKTGAFVCPSAVGNYTVGGLLFRPKGIEFFVSLTASASVSNVTSHGFADSFGNQNVSAYPYKIVLLDRCIYAILSLVSIPVDARLVSMNTDGFTLNFAAVDNRFTIRWLATG